MSRILYSTGFENAGALPPNFTTVAGYAIGTAQAFAGTYQLAITANTVTAVDGPTSTDVAFGSATPGDSTVSV